MHSMRLFHSRPVESSPLTLSDVPLPEPGPGQVRLKIKVCGVCHTDLHLVEGEIVPPVLPVTPGHQVVGMVDKMGPHTVTSVRVGDRVGVPWLHQACGQCEYCRRGEQNLCPSAHFTGFHTDGGFAEYMLARVDFVLPLPETISDEQAAPLLCAGIIGYRSLRKADLAPGEKLGLYGFGASAHLAIQVARYWGCPVYVFTRSAQHQQHALALGAEWAGTADDPLHVLLDRSIIFAPSGQLVPKALAQLRPGGTLAINAIHLSNIPELPYGLIYGERTLRSVANATYQDGLEFLKLAAEIKLRSTVTIYRLEDANRALQDLSQSRINGEGVLRIMP